jgi:hypothetical protein
VENLIKWTYHSNNNGATGTLYSIFESKHFSPVNGNWVHLQV